MSLLKDRPLMRFPWSKKEPEELPVDSEKIRKTVEKAYNDAYLEAHGWATQRKNRELIQRKIDEIKLEKMIRKILKENN